MFLLFWGLFAYVILVNLFIVVKGLQLRANKTDEGIKKYIRFAKKLFLIPNNPTTWSILRVTFNMVADNDDIDYVLRVDLFNILRNRGVYGLYYPRTKDNRNLNRVEKVEPKKKVTFEGMMEALKDLREQNFYTEEQYLREVKRYCHQFGKDYDEYINKTTNKSM